MQDFINVPVPSGLVTDVMGFIAERSGLSAVSDTENTKAESSASLPEVRWSPADLEKLYATPSTSARTVSALLTALSEVAPKPLSTSELEALTGIDRVNIRGSLSAFTRHVKTHYGRTNWPMDFQWGPQISVDYPAEAYYNVTEGLAETWKEITGR
jgi:hypothetical protein